MPAGQTPKELVKEIFSKPGYKSLAKDERLVDYVSKMPKWLAVTSLQDCAKLDLSNARNKSAYVMGVLQRQVAEKNKIPGQPAPPAKRPREEGDGDGEADSKGYEGGRMRGGKVLKEKRAKKKRAAAAAGAEDGSTTAAATGGEPSPAVEDSSTAVEAPDAAKGAAGSRQKARGGSESKRRREEARALKRAQWQGAHGA